MMFEVINTALISHPGKNPSDDVGRNLGKNNYHKCKILQKSGEQGEKSATGLEEGRLRACDKIS